MNDSGDDCSHQPVQSESSLLVAALQRSLDAFNSGDWEGFLAIYDDGARLHFLGPTSPQGKQGARLYAALLENAFPDAEFHIEDLTIQGRTIAMRYRLVGTHLGNFLGKPPTYRAFEVEGYTIMRFDGDKCVEQWSLLDEMSLHSQLGLLQSSGQQHKSS